MKSKNIFLGIFSILIVFILLLQGCTNTKNVVPNQSIASNGKALIDAYCMTCHTNSGGENGRIAPPMFAVKDHYLDGNTSKDVFIRAITEFVSNPLETKTKMPGAVRRFGLMTKLALNPADLHTIATYIYETSMPAPEWYAQHKTENHAAMTAAPTTPENIGLDYAMKTKGVLGKNLMKAITEKGTEGAVAFCNLRAYPLTDSMAQAQNARIKRVSDKPRNSRNKANAEELQYIQSFTKSLENKTEIKPVAISKNDNHTVYYPIETMKMCLQCHGKKDIDIQPNVLSSILKKYPEDQATGYGENQLRGIWVVKWTDKK